CTVMGPRFEMQATCAIAVTGAEMPLTVNGAEAPAWATIALKAGDVVKIGAARAGVRGYIAFAGGLDVPVVLGSRSTYIRGRLGGIEGRAVRRDDVLRLLPPATERRRAVTRDALPSFGTDPELRVVLGPQADRFTDDGIAALLGSAYEMLPQSD